MNLLHESYEILIFSLYSMKTKLQDCLHDSLLAILISLKLLPKAQKMWEKTSLQGKITQKLKYHDFVKHS